jgi:hypothetical protein
MRLRRTVVWIGLLAIVAGTVFQVAGACGTILGSGLLAGLDPCAVLDCSGGVFAGVFNPCGDPTITTDNIFVRCP